MPFLVPSIVLIVRGFLLCRRGKGFSLLWFFLGLLLVCRVGRILLFLGWLYYDARQQHANSQQDFHAGSCYDELAQFRQLAYHVGAHDVPIFLEGALDEAENPCGVCKGGSLCNALNY